MKLLRIAVIGLVIGLKAHAKETDRYTPDKSITTLVKISQLLTDVRSTYRPHDLKRELTQLQASSAVVTGVDATLAAVAKVHADLRHLLREQLHASIDQETLSARWDEFLQDLSSAYFSLDSLRSLYRDKDGIVGGYISDCRSALVQSGKLVKIDRFE